MQAGERPNRCLPNGEPREIELGNGKFRDDDVSESALQQSQAQLAAYCSSTTAFHTTIDHVLS